MIKNEEWLMEANNKLFLYLTYYDQENKIIWKTYLILLLYAYKLNVIKI